MAVLAGRVAVMTGASAGIGAGLAAEGAKVALAARRERELAGVADGIRQRGGVAIPVVTDLTSDESIARLLATAQAEAGPVDVLVNNAGYAVWKPLEETAPANGITPSRSTSGPPPASAPRCCPECRPGGSAGSSTSAARPGWPCPGFVGTDMGYVVPGANAASFLTVEEVVDVARYLLQLATT